jgi:probable HAF family extracellular repeat protein
LAAFLWQKGRTTRLGTLRGFRYESEAVAINERGQVIGNSYGDNLWSKEHAFLWQNGRMTDLGTLGGRESEAIAINDRGEIIGFSDVAGGAGLSRAFLWQNGHMTDLGDTFFPSLLTSSGAVVGECDRVGLPGRSLCTWQNGRLILLGLPPGATRGDANAVNDRGQIVGNCVTSPPAYRAHPCLWHGATVIDLGTLRPGAGGRALAVNDSLQVVGQAGIGPPSGKEHAFVWQNDHMTDLGRHLGSAYSVAFAINRRGQVLGTARPTSVGADPGAEPGEDNPRAVLWTLTPTR